MLFFSWAGPSSPSALLSTPSSSESELLILQMADENMFFDIKEECPQDIKVPCDPLDLDYEWEKMKIKYESTLESTEDDVQFDIDYELKEEFKPELKNPLDCAADIQFVWHMKSEEVIISDEDLPGMCGADSTNMTMPQDYNQEEVILDSELIVFASPLSYLTDESLEEHEIGQNIENERTNSQHHKSGKELQQKDSLTGHVSNHNGKEQFQRPTRQKRLVQKLRETSGTRKRPEKRTKLPYTYKCIRCGKTFPRRQGLTKHVWTGKGCLPRSEPRTREERFVAKETAETTRPSEQETVLQQTVSKGHKDKVCEAELPLKALLEKPVMNHRIKIEIVESTIPSIPRGQETVLKQTVSKHPKGKVCEAEFNKKSLLKKHVMNDKSKMEIVATTTIPSIPREQDKQTVSKRHKGKVCEAEFNKKSLLKKHVMNDKSKIEIVATTTIPSIPREQDKQTVSKRPKDKVGEAEFTEKALLKKHVMNHKGKIKILGTKKIPSIPRDQETISNSHECKFCGRKYQMQGHLINHILKHTMDINDIDNKTLEVMKKRKRRKRRKIFLLESIIFPPQTHECTFCNAKFTERAQLVEHMLSHKAERLFACDLCPKRFMEKRVLRVHMLSHSPLQPFKCDICGQRFKQKSNIPNHMIIHEGEKRFKCSICHQRFMHKSNVKVHMVTHSTLRPHTCVLCGKSFKQKQHLKKHVMSHTGEKPFQCSVCLKRFVRKSILKVHMVSHNGVKPYKCKTCGKQFSSRDILNRHEMGHGVKSFKCEICERLFMFKSYLKAHMLIHANKDQSNSEKC